MNRAAPEPAWTRSAPSASAFARSSSRLPSLTRTTSQAALRASSEIWARISRDGGYTWDPPYVLQENIGICNVMSVSFLRLLAGDLLIGFLVKNHRSADCRVYVRRSADDGAT